MKATEEASLALTIELFGPMCVRVKNQPLAPLRSRKGLWLLALLALRHDREVAREWLAATLWPDSLESQGLANLRLTLSDLRAALGAAAARLRSPTPRTLRMELSEEEADFLVFDVGITQGDTPSLKKAVSAYRGELLEGCLEEWVFQEREARALEYLRALTTLAKGAMEESQWSEAVFYLRRAMASDPLRETTCQTLMRALAAMGDYAGVVQVYHELRQRLYETLQDEPSAETAVLYRQLRQEAQHQGERHAKVEPPQILHRASFSPFLPPPRIPLSSPQLPCFLTSFIGRERELQDAKASFTTARLVTLTGTGGVGKTRLALKIAEEMTEAFPGGVWFVELAALEDPALVTRTVAEGLKVREQAAQALLDTLVHFLNSRAVPIFLATEHAPLAPPADEEGDEGWRTALPELLVLDNCEHLVEACAQLAETLLRRCGHLRILATSRQALGVSGETNYSLAPFALPSRDVLEAGNDESLTQCDAVRLFVARTQLTQHDLVWTTETLRKAARVCHRLDGIPLAIELAAARMKVLGIDQIWERLDDRFRLLVGGNRVARQRQQTLRSLIDWSYALLTTLEKTLLRRLSIFVGGWTLEAAEGVCSDTVMTSSTILILLEMLIDKSLIVTEELASGTARYRMLETVRQYSIEKLREAEEEAVLGSQHYVYFLQLAETAEPELKKARQAQWLNQLDTEHENLRAALEWSLVRNGEAYTASAALRLAGALSHYWTLHGYLTEGRQYLKKVLGYQANVERSAAHAKALLWAGVLANLQNDYALAQSSLEESLEIERKLGNRQAFGELSLRFAQIAHLQGKFARACALAEEAVALGQEFADSWIVFRGLLTLGGAIGRLNAIEESLKPLEAALTLARELGDKEGIANTLNCLGQVAFIRCDYGQVRAFSEEALRISREIKATGTVAVTLICLGYAALALKECEEARRLFEEALTIVLERGDRRGLAWALHGVGRTSYAQGEYAEAFRFYRESLKLRREQEDPTNMILSLACLAEILRAQDQPLDAARLLGAVQALRSTWEVSLLPMDNADFERTLTETRAMLEEQTFTKALMEGGAMSREQALEFALEKRSYS